MRARRFVLGILFAAVSACYCLSAADLATLTVLHINDLHAQLTPVSNGNGGLARLAGVIRRERTGCKDCLLVEAGDVVQGSPVSTIFKGLPVYEIVNLISFDAGTFGNHEFDYGWGQAQKFLGTARQATVLGNLEDSRGAQLAPAPFVILNVNGLRVAVIGLITEDMKNLSTPALMGDWHVTPVYQAARRYAAEARKNADIVVLLGHLTPSEEAVVLHTIPAISIVVTGHAHDGMQAPLSEGNRVLVRVKANGEELGRLEAVVDKQSKSLASWNWKRIPVNAEAPEAQDVAKEVKHWEDEVTKVVDQPIATASREIFPPEVRRLIERAMCEATGADFAFMNAGGVRDKLPKGQLLARHVWTVMPFDNLVVTARVKGSLLPPVVAQGKSIDLEKMYTLAVSDFTAANQGAPSQLGVTGLEFGRDGPLLRDVILDYVRKLKVLE